MRTFKSSQPTREHCPRCSKKGLAVWHVTADFYTSTKHRERSCRYCHYTQFQSAKIEMRTNWVTDQATEDSYNTNK